MGTRELHGRTKQMKEQHVRNHGPSDLAPMMIVAFDDLSTFVGTVTTRTAEALEAGVRMGDLVAASIAKLRREHDNRPLRRIMLVTEGYMGSIEEHESPPTHGELAERFATEADSKVTEALITSTWHYDGDEIVYETMMSAFHYTDGGVLVWDKTEGPFGEHGEAGASGHISEQGRKAMR